MRDSTRLLIEEIDFVLAERKQLLTRGLAFRIVHRFRAPRTECWPGEEVFAIFLVHRGREYQLALSPALLLFADYMLRHSRLAQNR